MRKFEGAKRLSLLLIASSVFYSVAVDACSPMPGWQSPPPEAAYRVAKVVVHARVVSQERTADGFVATVVPISILKGQFVGNLVSTADSGQCGIGPFRE